MAIPYLTSDVWGSKATSAINRLIQAMNNSSYFDNGSPPYSGGEGIDIAVDNTLSVDLTDTDLQDGLSDLAENRKFANLLPNADFSIAQDGTSFVSPSNGDYVLDTWLVTYTTTGVVTVTQDADAPTAVEAGKHIEQSMKIAVTTADSSIAAADEFYVEGFVEGYDWQQLAHRDFNVTFWHKHTVTGTYCVYFANKNFGSPRYYIAEYTQSAADTWEKATLTVTAPADDATWRYDDRIGLGIGFVLAAGVDLHGAASTWHSAAHRATSNQVNALSSTSNNFMLADVQIGNASVITGYPNYQARLAHVQRYFEIGYIGMPYNDVTSGNTYSAVAEFTTEKRTIPAMSLTNDYDNRFPSTVGSTTRVATDSFQENRTADVTGQSGTWRSLYEADARY